MESFILDIHVTTSLAAAKSLNSINAFSTSHCRRHHRPVVRRPSTHLWSPELELIHLNLGFLRSILSLITRATNTSSLPWFLPFTARLKQWKAARQHHALQHPLLHATHSGPDPNMWQLLTTLPTIAAQLKFEADRCAALAASCHNHLLRKLLASVATKVNTALGSKDLKTVIGITGSKKKSMTDLSYVIANNHIIMDPSAVHSSCTEHFHHHHSLNPTIFPTIFDWSSPHTVAEARPVFQQHCQLLLPPALHGTIDSLWYGFTTPWTAVPLNSAINRASRASSTLSPCPTLSEFQSAIQRSPTSSPGISGLSFSHIKLWTLPTVTHVHQLLSLLWADHLLIPDHWHWKLLCPIPKANKDPQVLDNLRPIMLVECLRKLWVGILIHRLSVFLSQEDFLSASQHGYVAHKSTITSGLQLLDSIDDFNSNRIDIYLSSWDFTKAFDTLPFSLSSLALQRAFIPADLAAWLLQLDQDGRIIVRTPHALDNLRRHQLPHFQPYSPLSPSTLSYFKAGGGVAQGDVHSPYVWRLFIDILLRSLESLRPHLTPFPTISSSDYGYADDIISLACTLLDLQHKADIVSAFSIITGISISWSKLRATCQEWNRPTPAPTLTVWDTTSHPHVIPLARGLTVRHLGFQVSTNGDDSDALRATAAALAVSTAHLHRRLRWLPKEAILQTTARQTIAQTVYTTQLSTYSANQLQSLDRQLSKVYRATCKLWPTYPSALLHAPRSKCGLGLPSISQATYTSKARILQRSLYPSSLGDTIILRYLLGHGISPTFHHECTVPPPSTRHTSASNYWLDNLLQHCHESKLLLRRSGHPTTHSSETPLVQLLPLHSKFWIRNGLACLGDLVDPIHLCWIKTPKRIKNALPPFQSLVLPHWLRVGQCWRFSPTSQVVTEILGIQSTSQVTTRLWKLLPPNSRGRVLIELTDHFAGPIPRINLLHNFPSAERIYTSQDEVSPDDNITRRQIWLRQQQPNPSFPPPYSTDLFQEIMATISRHYPSQDINIYTDGSWQATGNGRDRALLLSSTSIGGASLIITSSSAWRNHPILVFSLCDDHSSPTAHAYTWELMALATAAMIQSLRPNSCHLFSDCTSAIHTITNITPSAALLDPNSIILFPIAQLQQRPTATHVPAHPELRIGTSRPWTQHEHGIHLADAAASPTYNIHSFPLLDLQHTNISLTRALSMFHSKGTWAWCYSSNIPILLPLPTIWQQAHHSSYLQQRDQAHAAHPAPAIPPISWQSRSWSLSSRVHRFPSSPTLLCARPQRILLNWSGIGANLNRGNHHTRAALCPKCGVLESEQHLLSVCTDPAYRLLLRNATLAAAHHVKTYSPLNPQLSFMHALHASLTSHPHGHLMFLGAITTNLASCLPTYDHSAQLIQSLTKTITIYLRTLSEGGLAVIDLARRRRQALPTPPPLPLAAIVPPPISSHRPSLPTHTPSPSPRPTQRSHKPCSSRRSTRPSRLQQVAQAAGHGDDHTRLLLGHHPLTHYYPRTSPPLPQHDYAATHPP